VDSIDRPGGQPITDDELKKHPKATYANVNISQFTHPILSDSESTASDSGQVEKLPTISEQIRKLHGVPIFPSTKPQVWQIGGGMYLSESTDTGLDRIDMQRPAEPLEPMKKPQPRQGSTFPSSPLTTAHIHAPRNPRGYYHTQVDDESSSNSAFEEDEEQDIKRRPEVGTSPQRKVPLLPPSHPPVVTSRQSHPPVVTSRQAQPPQVRVKRQATSLLERVHIELTVKM